MTPEALERELGEGTLRPAYLALGTEPLLRDEAARALLDAAFGASARDFDLDRLEGERCAPGDLLDAVRALPVLAERRVVWLREPEARRGGGRGLGDALASAVGELAEAARGGSAPPTLLLVTAAQADRRARWVRAFAEPAALVDCAPPRTARQATGFVRAEAKRRGIALGTGAAEALAEAVGPQLLLLRQELEKAALYAGEGAAVEREHVAATASQLAEEPVWELTDAIGEGRPGDALGVLARLLAGGAPPPVVLGSLAAHFRRLVRVRGGGRVGGPDFVRRKLEGQARRYAPARLRASLRAIHDVDAILKGQGALPPDVALERLVMGLASGPAAPARRARR